MRWDITSGGVFPDYVLPDRAGAVRTLSELQGRDPLVLMLAHGAYCATERRYQLELAAFQSNVTMGYARMVTCSIVCTCHRWGGGMCRNGPTPNCVATCGRRFVMKKSRRVVSW
jgi:hypothetical protein